MPDEQNTTNGQAGATPTGQSGGQTNGGTNTPPNSQQTNDGKGEIPTTETWDSWLVSLPDADRTRVTALYEAHTSGLKSALNSERESRRALEGQIRELQKTAEKGSDSERKLTEMVGQLEAANRRADFLESAVKPEVGLGDLEAAWIIVSAKPDDYINKRGAVDFALLKERHPGLFKTAAPTPRGNAGNGAGTPPPNQISMNDIIRGATGRG